MASVKTILIITTVIYISGFLLIHLYTTLVGAGVGVPVFNHYPGKCRVVPGIECGSEDFAVTKDGLAFISNGLNMIPRCDRSIHKGSIYIFDFKNPSQNATKLDIISESIDFDLFEPHGLSLWEHPYSKTLSLFVVDHFIKDRVLVFEYNKDVPHKLFHKETINDKNFVCLNDLVAIGPKSFYVTNLLATCKISDHLLMFEMLFHLRTGYVVLYDRGKTKIAASGLKMSNGINISPDGQYIYVASNSGQNINIFERNIESNDITHIADFPLMTCPDNIEVDKETGDLYIGAHRNFRLAFSDYNGTFPAPAHVLRLRALGKNSLDFEVTELLSSDGFDFVRGTSSATFYKGGLLVGTVFHRMAYCDVTVP